MRPTWVTVDLEAVAYNVAVFRDLVAPAEVCAVVKADGYGHGALPVAQAALGAGATWLAVALVEEAAALRGGGLDVPILLLSEPRQEEMAEVMMLGGVRPTVYTEAGIRAFAAVADPGAPVHLKVDTGMHRVGVRPAEALTTARLVQDLGLGLEGVFTHCSVADVPDDPFTDRQVRRFDLALDDLASAGIRPAIVHMANTAATVSRPDTRRDLVRVGIGVYGVEPSTEVRLHCAPLGLRQAMAIRSQVTHLQTVDAGEGVGYGHQWVSGDETRLATVPMGYADGLPRRWGLVGEALVGGHRRPLRGVVSMDALMVEVDDTVALGDEVILLGAQGNEMIGAAEVGEAIGLIPWEVLCSLSARPPRRYL